MQIIKPKNSQAMSTKAIATKTTAAPTTGPQLDAALARISDLEIKVSRLESALVVMDSGDAELSVSGNLTLYAGKAVLIGADQKVMASSPGASIELGTVQLKLTSTTGIQANVASEFTVSGSTVRFNAPLVNVDGMLSASTVKADSVIGASYTPGAGNVW